MDRLTATIKLPPEGVFISCTEEQLEEIRRADNVSPREIYRQLQAYEDTGLTPAEVVILKARSEKESFIDHLNMLCDMKDKQISELFHENQRLKKIISDIADIIRKEKD